MNNPKNTDQAVHTMSRFPDKNQLMRFAKEFVGQRVESLTKDVDHCLRGDAAFPAILYCFSTVDLLGALYAGNAKRKRDASTHAASYMTDFLQYSEEQARLLQKLFRHKIVHLAQPKAVGSDHGRLIAWRYTHNDKAEHLVLKSIGSAHVNVAPSWSINCGHQFNFSIAHFVEDIVNSVHKQGGYLDRLNVDPDLRDKFERAIEDIFDPNQ